MKFLLLPLLLSSLALPSLAQTRPKAKSKAKPKTTAAIPAATLARGAVVYKNVCLTCHQADGYGVPNLNPPLIKTGYVLGPKPRLIGIVLRGLPGPIEINGDEYKQPMPAQAYLTDAQVADVLTYVRNAFGNRAGAVGEVEVKAVRAAK